MVLLGVPYDGGSTYQPGSRLAPYHVRRTTALIQGYHPVHGVDVFKELACIDGGNVAFPPFDAPAVRDLIERDVRSVYQSRAIPFVVGGDHSITLPILRAAAHAHGPVAVLHVDAHLDTSGPEVWGEAFHHGTPIRHAIDEGLIAREQLFQVGIRAPYGHCEEDAPSRAHGAKIYRADELASSGVALVAKHIQQKLGNRPLYITFDVDGIDPAFAPGTGTPVPGGLTTREALELLRGLAGCKLVGMDVVEVAPNLDHADMTCHLAAHLLYEGLARAAISKRGR